MSAKRLPLLLALLLTPDSRPRTRYAVMRAAINNERSGFAALSPARRKRMFRGMSKSQRAWVSVGISVYGIARTKPLLLPLFAVSIVYFVASLISRII